MKHHLNGHTNTLHRIYHPVRHNDNSPSLMLRYNVTSSKQDHPTARMKYKNEKGGGLSVKTSDTYRDFKGHHGGVAEFDDLGECG